MPAPAAQCSWERARPDPVVLASVFQPPHHGRAREMRMPPTGAAVSRRAAMSSSRRSTIAPCHRRCQDQEPWKSRTTKRLMSLKSIPTSIDGSQPSQSGRLAPRGCSHRALDAQVAFCNPTKFAKRWVNAAVRGTAVEAPRPKSATKGSSPLGCVPARSGQITAS
jgi:hypothetical protein